MATPIVSGAAALVRQYFVDGLFPQGSVVVPGQAAGGFSPSSALLRAVLLASAQSVSPLAPTRDGDPFSLNNIPSLSQGHGIIQLDSVLTFNDITPPLLRFFAVDRKSMTSPSVDYYAFQAETPMAPQVTLSWTDPVMRTANPVHSVLYNDLNLELRTPSGRVIPGNFARHVVNGVAYAVYDTDNNNERVVMHPKIDAEAGTWTVAVRTNRLLKPQQYALVFSAAVAFTKVEPTPLATCPSDCSGKGKCLAGQCMCDDDHTGMACDMPVLTAPLGQLFSMPSLTLNAQSWTFIRVPVTTGTIVNVVQSTSTLTNSGDPDLYMVARKRGDRLWLPTTVASINQTAPPNWKCDAMCCDYASGQLEPCSSQQCRHSILFTVTDASVSEYVLGVQASCCDTAVLHLTIDTRSNASLCAKVDPQPSPNVSPADASSADAPTAKTVIIICGENPRRRYIASISQFVFWHVRSFSVLYAVTLTRALQFQS
jgi:hypothetical protein